MPSGDLDNHLAQDDAELSRVKGLPEEGEPAAVEHQPLQLQGRVAGDEDRRQLRPLAADLRQRLHAAEIGEIEVEETDLDRHPPDDLDRLETPRGGVDGMAVLDEEVLEGLEEPPVVIQDQDAQTSAVAFRSKTLHGLFSWPGRRKGYASLTWLLKLFWK